MAANKKTLPSAEARFQYRRAENGRMLPPCSKTVIEILHWSGALQGGSLNGQMRKWKTLNSHFLHDWFDMIRVQE